MREREWEDERDVKMEENGEEKKSTGKGEKG